MSILATIGIMVDCLISNVEYRLTFKKIIGPPGLIPEDGDWTFVRDIKLTEELMLGKGGTWVGASVRVLNSFVPNASFSRTSLNDVRNKSVMIQF